MTVEITKEVTGPLGNRRKPFAMNIIYWEDGQSLRSKTVRASMKNGDKITLKHVDIGSDIIITETVDTSKYRVWISQKEEQPAEADLRGKAEGRKEGHEEGIRLAKQVFQLSSSGESIEEIARMCNISVEEVRGILE